MRAGVRNTLMNMEKIEWEPSLWINQDECLLALLGGRSLETLEYTEMEISLMDRSVHVMCCIHVLVKYMNMLIISEVCIAWNAPILSYLVEKKDSVEWNNKHLLITPNMITTSPVWDLEIQNVAAAENASCGSFVLQRQIANGHNCKCVCGLAKGGQQQKALKARCTVFALVLFVTQVLTLTVVFLGNEI